LKHGVTGPQIPNVLIWAPLPGTNPNDRTTMHIFTLRINNTVGKITESNANNWVQLYQNGLPLTRVNVISSTQGDSTLSTTSAGGTTIVNNVLFSQYDNVSWPAGSKSGGAPIANSTASIGISNWSFAENNVDYKSSGAHSDSDILNIATTLCTKWGILPPLS
jgi:hypothetical protein